MKHLVAIFLLSPFTAFAHTGDHRPDFFANLARLLTQPDHLIILACVATLAGVVLYLRKAGKL